MVTKKDYCSVLQGLQSIYEEKIKPIEAAFRFDSFFSPLLSQTEIAAKPIVLLLGQYSTGKTTFLRSLLGRDYPGARIGPEPTTDRFVAVMEGVEDRVIPGNAATVQPEMPFAGLQRFGAPLLSKFQVSEMSQNSLLSAVTLVDTPGVLAGDKQRLGRVYSFPEVCQWWAEHSDLILLFFDAHKLDISDELKQVIEVLRPHDDKIRLVLNKADQVNQQELMRVYGALMWSLGKVIGTPEVMRVFVGSFQEETQDSFLEGERQELLDELSALPNNATTRRINDMVKRVRLVRVHAILVNHLRSQLPMLFRRASTQERLLTNLAAEFTKVQQEYNLPAGDFPDLETWGECLRSLDLSSFPKLSSRHLNALDETLRIDIPALMTKFPANLTQLFRSSNTSINPFCVTEQNLSVEEIDMEQATQLFISLHPEKISKKEMGSAKLAGNLCRKFFLQSKLPEAEMAKLWTLADSDSDGMLNLKEFAMLLHLTQNRVRGGPIPESLSP